MFNMTGWCESCGKPIGILKATSIWVGTKAYPTRDSVTYHIHSNMVLAKIKCD